MKIVYQVNFFLLLSFLTSWLFSQFENPILLHITSILAFLVIFVLFGLNFSIIIQIVFKKKFTWIEILTIGSISALIFHPLVLSLEYEILNILHPAMPLINTALSLLFLFILSKIYKNRDNVLPNCPKISRKIILSATTSPIFLSFLLIMICVSIVNFSYYPLPELDPYYWHSKSLEQFSDGKLENLNGYRPLFISLIYIFSQSIGIDQYFFLKYIFPFLNLLVLIPAYMLMKTSKDKLKQFAFFLSPTITASTFLYSQMQIPQAVINIIFFYFVFLLLHSKNTKDSFFFFLGGIAVFFSYFYHEMAIIIFVIWALVATIAYRKKLYSHIKENKLLFIVFSSLILLGLSSTIEAQFYFLSKYFMELKVFRGFNFLFPAHYINCDKISMGWPGVIGVVKYYTYYVGPVIFLLGLIFFYLLLSKKNFRNALTSNIKNKEFLVIFVIFSLFFSISEIFPRLLNLAFLPERSWTFTGIFSLFFLFYILKFTKNNIFPILFIFAFLINLGGALYVNNFKKYSITKDQLRSAEWIKKNLPKNKAIITMENSNLLRVYAESKVIVVSDKFYLDEKYFQNKINNLLEPSWQHQNTEENKDVYIYYSKPDKRNPYVNRPYAKNHSVSDFIFDKYPNSFSRIYFDTNANIIIWKIL